MGGNFLNEILQRNCIFLCKNVVSCQIGGLTAHSLKISFLFNLVSFTDQENLRKKLKLRDLDKDMSKNIREHNGAF